MTEINAFVKNDGNDGAKSIVIHCLMFDCCALCYRP